jgi:hypothetical protein
MLLGVGVEVSLNIPARFPCEWILHREIYVLGFIIPHFAGFPFLDEGRAFSAPRCMAIRLAVYTVVKGRVIYWAFCGAVFCTTCATGVVLLWHSAAMCPPSKAWHLGHLVGSGSSFRP